MKERAHQRGPQLLTQYFELNGTFLGAGILGQGALEEGEMHVSGKSARLAELAKRRAADKGLGYAAALSEVSREQPKLAIEAMAETADVGLRCDESTGRMTYGYRSDPPAGADEELVLLARERAKANSITFSEALRDVARRAPALVELYREAVTHRKR